MNQTPCCGEQETMDSRADADVIKDSIANPGAFAAVFDRHAGVLFRFLVRRVGRDIADELLGETFRVAFEARTRFDCERPTARPWLYGIATNLVAKHRRSEARRLHATARLAADRSGDAVADHVAARVDAAQTWPTVATGIAQLPDAERDVLLLFVWEELTYEEIAAALTIPIGTVRSRLNRARARLRDVPVEQGSCRG